MVLLLPKILARGDWVWEAENCEILLSFLFFADFGVLLTRLKSSMFGLAGELALLLLVFLDFFLGLNKLLN